MRHRQANDCYQSIARPENRMDLRDNITLGEGRGNTFIMFLKIGKSRLAGFDEEEHLCRKSIRILFHHINPISWQGLEVVWV